MMFILFLLIVIAQRLGELAVAKRNEAWMKQQGGIEFGSSHYPWMVAMHAAFFVVFIIEVYKRGGHPSAYWPVFLVLFLILQASRIWALTSLGRFWNTKIIVLPDAKAVKKGPYKFIKHPNYIIVALELIVIPLLFNACITACLFTLLNIFMMLTRIPEEEKALKKLTNYQ
ncbi:isoprenylcysteine carboxyl methyltransferase family protein [Peribacillus kribbensis]|uniref:isoprenylcysteine carboxyl methyltransferase family protein n=1 Tax=Peribacillus kribbensis TaxID=356658 RepID=UPI000478B2DE|nr:isoprenylcysteine carboxylmethyltransferase family protein [Peribacillus kribbensis]